MSWRHWLLLGVVATITVIVFLLPPIPQSEAYHHFADTRAFRGIPNAHLIVSLLIYALAKGFEAMDRPIFNMGGIISGHTLKHIAAALSAYWILRMLQLRRPIWVAHA
jgi:hypothetical protein